MNNLQIYIFIVLISYTSELAYNDCKQKTVVTYTISLLHNFGSIYLYYGSLLFGFYKLHLLILLGTLIGWYLNQNRCILTDYYNKLCKIKSKSPFKDINYRINSSILKVNNFHLWLAGFALLYDIYHIL